MKHKLLFSLFTTVALTFATLIANAQYYSLSKTYHPGNPNGLNTDPDFDNTTYTPPAGSTVLINYPYAKSYALQYTPTQTIPFSFNFNGSAVTQYKISTSGYITFTTSAVTPVGTPSTTLPNASLPNNTICCWGFGGAGLGGQIYTKVYGTTPNRQLWIVWWFAGNPTDTNSQNMWAIVLEETTNHIYVVDEWGMGNVDCSCTYNPINLSIGVQINSSTAYQIAGSPNINSQTTSAAPSDNNYYEFIYGTQPTYDAAVVNSNITNANLYAKNVPYTINAGVYNAGSVTLTSFDLNYKVNGGATQTDPVSSASVAPSIVDNVAHTIQWTPPAIGTYSMKIWADNLNGGNNDQDHTNDTLFINNIKVIDSVVTKVPLVEEFNQASCDPCAMATPNLDSVLWNSMNICSAVRYHVNWPGQDFMNQVTNAPFVSSRVSYYSVSGVPDAKLDGSTDIYPGSLSSTDIQNEAAPGSPILINITNCTYSAGVYSFSAAVKAFENFPSGLAARVVLTVDTITYKANQSTESIPQYVFPQVAEDMMPSASGTTLSAYTSGQTQTVTTSWTQNHPWGASPKTWIYDSTNCHITIFIQDPTTKYVYQSANLPVTNAPLAADYKDAGVNYFNLYPNPANSKTNIEFSLTEEHNVSVEVFNMLGEKVFGIDDEKMAAGPHSIPVEAKGLQSGVYFVKLATDGGFVTKRLAIQ